ncbi:hypothetical protein RFI_35634 [Reticulomyxa filosa]|uniref:Uncharacterized protein n=1 Tax=Reticulomyxa filosa TaxID=46433 RepID=X6LM59_RETFI|nr:hypothetical protein RFI_35634 [Reticulomyxa filosa]|eukprot:ETO01805.1 hypothetical protein RFI_35634 [Reticulomyxa filosa]
MKEIADLETKEMKEIMEKHCSHVARASPLHQTAFYKYLYNQFQFLAYSVLLANDMKESKYWPIRFKHAVTDSVIKIGAGLSYRCYQRKGVGLEESNGEDEFYLCEQWRIAQDFLYLVNQDDAGLKNFFIWAVLQ